MYSIFADYWMVVDKGTGNWLPICKTATAAELTKDKPPRLFKKRHHAKTAITHWLKGIMVGITDRPDPIASDTMWPDAEAVTKYVRVKGSDRPQMKDRLEIKHVVLAEVIKW